MAHVIWSPRALADLEGICEYIARDSERYAKFFAQRAVALIESIPAHPLLGSVVPEYGQADLRERRLQSYRIVYRLTPERIEIVAIVHGARLLPDVSSLPAGPPQER
jgi:plasmid stabilization system protein ParE